MPQPRRSSYPPLRDRFPRPAPVASPPSSTRSRSRAHSATRVHAHIARRLDRSIESMSAAFEIAEAKRSAVRHQIGDDTRQRTVSPDAAIAAGRHDRATPRAASTTVGPDHDPVGCGRSWRSRGRGPLPFVGRRHHPSRRHRPRCAAMPDRWPTADMSISRAVTDTRGQRTAFGSARPARRPSRMRCRPPPRISRRGRGLIVGKRRRSPVPARSRGGRSAPTSVRCGRSHR